MKSQEYWAKRSEQIALTQHAKADKYAEKRLKGEYDRATAALEKEIDSFYSRFAINNDITYSDAQRLLDGNELKDFKMGVEKFIELAKDNPDGRWTRILNNASYKVRISRLQALKIQMEAVVQNLSMTENKAFSELLRDIYSDNYYRTIFELQKGMGLGASFSKIDLKTLETVLKRPWEGANFSQRIWGDNQKLTQQLVTEFSQALIRGEGARNSAKILSKRMGVGYRSAVRLIRTESSFIQNEASYEGYKQSGVVKKYEILATLDGKTSRTCRFMDGQIFTLAEKQVGITWPPFHSNCRTTTVPYFDDEINPGERVATGADGKTYTIPGDMNYQQWYDKYVNGGE